MPDIERIDLLDTQDTLQGVIQQDFYLTDYQDGNLSTVVLASGCTEEVGDQIYRVIDGDLTVTDSGVADGIVYVHIMDDGDGTASATIETTSGTFDPNKRGYYTGGGAKVVFSMNKSSGTYSHKGRLLLPDAEGKQIGEVFGVHPDLLRLPNPFNFAPCDGVAFLPTDNFSTGNDTNVPDLTDDRFLQGSSSYGDGGVNSLNMEHSHTVNSHSHSISSNLGEHNHRWYVGNSESVAGQTFNSGGSSTNIIFEGAGTPSSVTSISAQNKTAQPWLNMDGYTDNEDLSHSHGGSTGSDSPGTDNQLSSTQEMRPLYFSVIYFMRIN